MRHTLLALFALLLAAAPVRAAWDPTAFAREDTLEILTVGPEEGEHWSTVWLVVLDGQVYLRLGTRAAERVEANTAKPKVKVRIAGQTFDDVTAEPAPEQVEAVDKAMHEKYWSDVFIQFFSHPLTVRLIPN